MLFYDNNAMPSTTPSAIATFTVDFITFPTAKYGANLEYFRCLIPAYTNITSANITMVGEIAKI